MRNSTVSRTTAAVGPNCAESNRIMSELSLRSRRGISGNAGSLVPFDAERSPCSERSRQSGKVAPELAPLSSIRLKGRMFETPYCSIDWDGTRGLARFVRTGLPYATIAAIDEDGMAIQRVLERAGKIRLLVDLRPVKPRNDPSFEVAIANFRRRVLGGRQRVAILVRTAVGALQVKRHIREDGFHVEVFTSEEEALAYLDMRPSERAPCASHDGPAPRSRSFA